MEGADSAEGVAQVAPCIGGPVSRPRLAELPIPPKTFRPNSARIRQIYFLLGVAVLKNKKHLTLDFFSSLSQYPSQVRRDAERASILQPSAQAMPARGSSRCRHLVALGIAIPTLARHRHHRASLLTGPILFADQALLYAL